MRVGIMILVLFVSSACLAAELPRRDNATDETHSGLTVEYGELAASDGVKLRTILTRPENSARPPVILFVQWLSCDTVELRPGANDGWTQMMRGMIRESGWAVMRTDKRGVGDSEGGPCSSLDYDTELNDHRAALAALTRRTDIDTDRIVVFGASMGSRMAAQVAAGHANVVGVMTWGGGSKTWFERMLAFDRNAMERGGADPGEIATRMRQHERFYSEYLLEGRNPPDIIAADPEQGAVWSDIIGTSASDHYGRPFAFHHQAQNADWTAAWGQITVPVLVVMGEFDWFENLAGHQTVVNVVNMDKANRARLEIIPGMDHHFSIFDSAQAAFRDETGTPDAAPFHEIALPWLNKLAN